MPISGTHSIMPLDQEAVATQFHYSPGIRIGDTLHISGQLGVDKTGAAIADPELQFVAVFGAIRAVLTQAGFGFEDIVVLNTFHSSFDEMALFAAVKDRFIVGPTYPAWTAVGATLTIPGAHVEVSCTADRSWKGGMRHGE